MCCLKLQDVISGVVQGLLRGFGLHVLLANSMPNVIYVPSWTFADNVEFVANNDHLLWRMYNTILTSVNGLKSGMCTSL